VILRRDGSRAQSGLAVISDFRFFSVLSFSPEAYAVCQSGRSPIEILSFFFFRMFAWEMLGDSFLFPPPFFTFPEFSAVQRISLLVSVRESVRRRRERFVSPFFLSSLSTSLGTFAGPPSNDSGPPIAAVRARLMMTSLTFPFVFFLSFFLAHRYWTLRDLFSYSSPLLLFCYAPASFKFRVFRNFSPHVISVST